MDVHVQRTTNALWNTDNVFSTYSNFNAEIQGSNSVGPNRFISEVSNVNFLDSNSRVSRIDKVAGKAGSSAEPACCPTACS
jgi:hypothetical protein